MERPPDAHEVLVLGREDVRRVLPMAELVRELEGFFLRRPEVVQPQRTIARMGGGVWLLMPSHVRGYGVSVKTVNEYPLPDHAHGIIELYDEGTGIPLALLNSAEITRLRTGALGALAIKYIYKKKSAIVGVIGSGEQAEGQLEGAATVLTVERAYVYSRDPRKRSSFAARMRERLGVEVVDVDEAKLAVERADVVLVATNSEVPVLSGEWLREGSHLNSLGTLPERRELDDETFRRASLVVFDSYEGVMREAGDVIHAIGSGALDRRKIAGELADVVRSGGIRRADGDITLFKSVGIGYLDAIAARLAYSRAREANVGSRVMV